MQFINLCDSMPLNIAQTYYYELYTVQRMIRYVIDLTSKRDRSTLYDSYQIILSRKTNTIVLTRIKFSTDTIVTAEFSH